MDTTMKALIMVNFLYIGVNGCIFCFFQALKVIKTSIDAKDTADAVAAPAIPKSEVRICHKSQSKDTQDKRTTCIFCSIEFRENNLRIHEHQCKDREGEHETPFSHYLVDRAN